MPRSCSSTPCFPRPPSASSFFFSPAPAPSEIYTLSLHDALPISTGAPSVLALTRGDMESWTLMGTRSYYATGIHEHSSVDRKSTRLNSSHTVISYAVFCLKKKKKKKQSSYHQLEPNINLI